MKLVKGRTLQGILNDLRHEVPSAAKQYPLAHLLTIFRKVCDAMAFAHSRGIIHRDLKPENIMVGEFGEVLVMDWGLAKILNAPEQKPAAADDPATTIILPGRQASPLPETSTSSMMKTLDGSIMGTPQYMSPEQAEGRIAGMDARSDIFSLGGILYAILTLRPPVEGKTLDEVLQKVISGSIAPLSVVRAGARRRLRLNGNRQGRRALSIHNPSASQSSRPARRRHHEGADGGQGQTLSKRRRPKCGRGGLPRRLCHERGTGWRHEAARAAHQARHRAVSVALLPFSSSWAWHLSPMSLSAQHRMAATLAELRSTAPTFAAQARALVDAGKLDQALENVGHA